MSTSEALILLEQEEYNVNSVKKGRAVAECIMSVVRLAKDDKDGVSRKIKANGDGKLVNYTIKGIMPSLPPRAAFQTDGFHPDGGLPVHKRSRAWQ